MRMNRRLLAFTMSSLMMGTAVIGDSTMAMAIEDGMLLSSEEVKEPQEYKVTLKADPGYFVFEDEKEISEYEIYVSEDGRYKDSYAIMEDTEERLVYDSLPKPQLEGYEFVCWYADEEPGEYLFEDMIITDDTEVEPVEDRIFYAVWEKAETGDDEFTALVSAEDTAEEDAEASEITEPEDEESEAADPEDVKNGDADPEAAASKEESGMDMDTAKNADTTENAAGAENTADTENAADTENTADTENAASLDSALAADKTDNESEGIPAETDKDEEISEAASDGEISGDKNESELAEEELLKMGDEDEKTFIAEASDVVFSNKKGNFFTTVTVRDDNGKKLSAGKDYEKAFAYTYEEDVQLLDAEQRSSGDTAEEDDTVPAGTTLKVTVTGKGDFEGAVATAQYRVTAMSISKASVTIQNKIYNGTPVTLEYSEILVKVGNEILTPEDFEIDASSYRNNEGKGKGSVTLYGKGDYGGSKTATFTIENPPAGFTVIYYGNGATGGKMKKQSASSGSIEIMKNAFVRDGYLFTGWNTSPKGDGTSYEEGALVTAADGSFVELYAQWASKSFTVTYHTNGGRNNPLNTKLTFTADDDTFEVFPPDKEDWTLGYQFGGWYLDSAYTKKVTRIKKGTCCNVDLYAKWVPYSYKVFFDGNGAIGNMAPMAFSYGVAKKLPANKFKKPGYAFLGWSLIRDGEALVKDKEDFSGVIKRDEYKNSFNEARTLYAVWGASFDIEYELEGGTMPSGQIPYEYTYGSKIALPVPVRAGYGFGGWFTDAGYGTKLKAITAKTAGDLKLYAKWDPLKITFIFKGNGSDSGFTKNQTLLFSQSTGELSACGFVKKAAAFTGWNTAADGSGYQIAYDRSEGRFTTDVPIADFIEGSHILDAGAIVKNTKVTLYACWTESDYSISYVTGGGTLPEDAITSYRHGNEGGYELPVPRRSGDSFLGWYLDPSFKKKIDRITESTFGDLTLYAMWEAGDKQAYRIVFDADAPSGCTVTGKMSDQKMVFNTAKAITANRFRIKGYTFKGWSLVPLAERGDAGADYFDKETVTGFESKGGPKGEKNYRPEVTLYGVWEKELYQVTLYNVNAPEIMDAVETFSYSIDQEIVFAAPRSSGTKAVYIGDEDENTDEPIRYLAEPYKMGDTFLGWYLDKNCKKKATGIRAGSTGKKVFYAKWQTTRYTINYDMNGGPADAVLVTEKAGYVTDYGSRYESGYLLATAYGTGKQFVGWYKEKACKNRVANIISSPYVDMTVYAKWEDYTYRVVFDKNDDRATGSTKAMNNLNMSRDYKLSGNGFKLDGYEMKNWNTVPAPTAGNPGLAFDDKAVISGGMLCDLGLITETGGSVKLYAQWGIHEFTVTYHLYGGTNGSGNPESFTVMTELKTLADPTMPGYSFDGWYRDSKFTIPVVKNPEKPEDYAIPLGTSTDLDFYAKWSYESKSIEDLEPGEYISLDSNPRYPVDPTGVENSADGINEAIEKAYNNDIGYVYLPAGNYSVKYTGRWYKSGILMRSNVTLLMDDETYIYFESDEGADDCAISMINTENCSVIGGHLIGDNKKNTYDRYGIWIKGTTNSTVANMEICNMYCEGIYLAVQQHGDPEDISDNVGNDGVNIINCYIHDNWRNNIGIVDADNVKIEGCRILNVGSRSPHACICIEPNTDCSGDGICSNIYIKNCEIKTGKSGSNWEYRAFYTYSRPERRKKGYKYAAQDVTFDACEIQGYIGNHHGKNVEFINGTTHSGTYNDDPNPEG